MLAVFDFPLVASSATTGDVFDLLSVGTKSFGQLMFQDNSIAGIIFILAIIVNSKHSVLYGLYTAVLGSLIGLLFKNRFPQSMPRLWDIMRYSAPLPWSTISEAPFFGFQWLLFYL